MSDLLTAIRFLTILPLGRGEALEPKKMAASMAWFPFVGLLLGAALMALDLGLTGRVFPRPVVDAILIAFMALVTGGLHLDGFADTLDGTFGGRGDKARTLEIMKDSRIGAMGVVGIAVLLLLKFTALGGVPADDRWHALVLMPVLARWSQVSMAFRAKAARSGGSLAGSFVEYLGFGHLLLASLATLAAAFFIGGTTGVAALAAVSLLTLASKAHFNRWLGGITGDTIGCVSEINEVLVLLVFTVII